MALTEAAFSEKMDKLNNSQQSIENTSSWCVLWRADARSVAEYWERAFTRAGQDKRLSMIYLANDVLQTRCAPLSPVPRAHVDVGCLHTVNLLAAGCCAQPNPVLRCHAAARRARSL